MIDVAVLDEDGVLVGSKRKKQLGKNDVAIGDLPTDGSYKLMGGQFIPVGFGHGKPKAPKHSRDEILAMLIMAIESGAKQMPSECVGWAKCILKERK